MPLKRTARHAYAYYPNLLWLSLANFLSAVSDVIPLRRWLLWCHALYLFGIKGSTYRTSAHARADEDQSDPLWLKNWVRSGRTLTRAGTPALVKGPPGDRAVRHPRGRKGTGPSRPDTRARTARVQHACACTCLHSCARLRLRAPRRASSAHAACAPEWECPSGQFTACARELLLALWLPVRTRSPRVP